MKPCKPNIEPPTPNLLSNMVFEGARKHRRQAIFCTALFLGSLLAYGQVGTAVRELPYDFHPGDLVEVRLQVTPPANATNWSVVES